MSVLFRGFQRMIATTAPGSSRLLNNGGGMLFPGLSQHPQVRYHVCLYSTAGAKAATKEEIDKLVKKKPLVVFMKGVPEEPRCGFSNAVVQVLRMHGVTSYDSYNVLEDEAIRQGVKEYSNWPTIPQIYINGEFIGGCDIFLEMHKNGELEEQLAKAGIKSTIATHDHGGSDQKGKSDK